MITSSKKTIARQDTAQREVLASIPQTQNAIEGAVDNINPEHRINAAQKIYTGQQPTERAKSKPTGRWYRTQNIILYSTIQSIQMAILTVRTSL